MVQAKALAHEQRDTYQKTHEKNDLLTVREVAQRLRVDETTVRRWIGQGVLDAIALPHKGKRQAYRIKQQTIDHLLQASETSPAESIA